MGTRILAGTIVAAFLVSAGLAPFAAAQGVGAIGGTISDSSDAALYGDFVTPPNVEDYPNVPGGRATLIARLPLQALFIYWVYLATQTDDTT